MRRHRKPTCFTCPDHYLTKDVHCTQSYQPSLNVIFLFPSRENWEKKCCWWYWELSTMIGEYKVCQFLPSRHAPHARVRDEAASSTVDNLWEVCAMAESAARGHLPRPRESVTHWLAATSKHIDIIFLQASVYTSPEPSIGRHRPASAPPPVGNKLQGFSTSAYQSTPKLAFSMYIPCTTSSPL